MFKSVLLALSISLASVPSFAYTSDFIFCPTMFPASEESHLHILGFDAVGSYQTGKTDQIVTIWFNKYLNFFFFVEFVRDLKTHHVLGICVDDAGFGRMDGTVYDPGQTHSAPPPTLNAFKDRP